MTGLIMLLVKGLVAGLIVGFVTASIRSWVDRFFLVIILVGLLRMPIQEAVVVNLIVVSLAALMMMLRQTQVLTSVQADWPLVILPAALGGMLGRVVALNVRPQLLLGILGVYAILAGVRLVLIKPLPERENKAHPAWIAPIAGLSGALAGFLSAGGKPFTVPVYNAALGHHPRRAYALASLGVVSGAWLGLFAQIGLGHPISQDGLLLAVYLFVVIVLTALAVERIWTERLNRIVTLTVAPLLVLVGLRFVWVVLQL
ncbi:MAG: sulfite exporter TauE/SafE family protein [Chloroflexi bacterium]|nr:MAG: sulfite exporter TauE/SafE family protein [Chloroflexota bacterium]